MKRSVICTLCLLATVYTHASDGNIKITGLITSNTCKISNSNINVQLPTISQSSLQTANSTAGSTPFKIELTNCQSAGNVTAYFEPGTNVDYATGFLNNTNTSDAANNVQVQILSSNHQVIPIKAVDSQSKQPNSMWVATNNGEATLQYYAQYISQSGKATPGTVNTNVNYTIIYQ